MITIVTEGFQEAVDGYDAENPNEFVDLVQATFECCGVNGPKDYTLKGKSVPDSCGDNMAELAVDALTATGCGSTVKEKLDDYSILAAGVALGAGVVMVSYSLANLIMTHFRDQKVAHLMMAAYLIPIHRCAKHRKTIYAVVRHICTHNESFRKNFKKTRSPVTC